MSEPINPVVYQAVSGTFDKSTTIDKTVKGASSVGCINFGGPTSPGVKGAFLLISNILRSIAGLAVIDIRYSTPSKDRPCELFVNDKSVGVLPMENTGGDDKWDVQSIIAAMSAGVNAVRIVVSSSNGGPNIDTIIVSDPKASPLPATPPFPPKSNPDPTPAPAPPNPIPTAVDYVIDSIWPVALKGLKTIREIQGKQYILPLPSNTGLTDLTKISKPAKFAPVSGKPSAPTVYRDVDWGSVSIKGLHDISFYNCRFNAGRQPGNGWTVPKVTGSPYAVNASGSQNILFEHCEILGAADALVYGNGMTIRYCLLHHAGADAMKLEGDCLVEFNYVAYLGWNNNAAHADFVQSVDDVHNVIVRYNFFDGDLTSYPGAMQYCKCNALWQLQGNSNNSNCQFVGNWCRKATKSSTGVHMYDVAKGQEKTYVVMDNLVIGCPVDVSNGAIVSGNVDLFGKSA